MNAQITVTLPEPVYDRARHPRSVTAVVKQSGAHHGARQYAV